MAKWTKVTIMVDGYPVKVYIDPKNITAYVFPPFRMKYYCLRSDQGVLDFATTFLLVKNHNNVVSFQNYLSSFEDTMPIYIEKPAA